MLSFLKKEFDDEGYITKQYLNEIIVIEDFLSEEEVQILLNIINNSTEDDWKKSYLENLKNFCIEKFGRDDVENLIKEGKFEVTDNWSDKILPLHKINNNLVGVITQRLQDVVDKVNKSFYIPGYGSIQRQYKDVPLKPHTDQHTDPSIGYAAIIYINDDYVDGELYFSNKDFSIKPNRKSLVIFPGTEEWNHGVNAPGDGPFRYVLPGFIRYKDFYENNKY